MEIALLCLLQSLDDTHTRPQILLHVVLIVHPSFLKSYRCIAIFLAEVFILLLIYFVTNTFSKKSTWRLFISNFLADSSAVVTFPGALPFSFENVSCKRLKSSLISKHYVVSCIRIKQSLFSSFLLIKQFQSFDVSPIGNAHRLMIHVFNCAYECSNSLRDIINCGLIDIATCVRYCALQVGRP